MSILREQIATDTEASPSNAQIMLLCGSNTISTANATRSRVFCQRNISPQQQKQRCSSPELLPLMKQTAAAAATAATAARPQPRVPLSARSCDLLHFLLSIIHPSISPIPLCVCVSLLQLCISRFFDCCVCFVVCSEFFFQFHWIGKANNSIQKNRRPAAMTDKQTSTQQRSTATKTAKVLPPHFTHFPPPPPPSLSFAIISPFHSLSHNVACEWIAVRAGCACNSNSLNYTCTPERPTTTTTAAAAVWAAAVWECWVGGVQPAGLIAQRLSGWPVCRTAGSFYSRACCAHLGAEGMGERGRERRLLLLFPFSLDFCFLFCWFSFPFVRLALSLSLCVRWWWHCCCCFRVYQ